MSAKSSLHSINRVNTHDSLETYEITSGFHRAILSRFGGQLIAWEFKQIPILFENKHADLSATKPYRGGAPICFPYFGDGHFIDGHKHEPAHGSVRKEVWSTPKATSQEDGFLIELNCSAFSITNIPLTLNVRYFFESTSLRVSFNVINTGIAATPIQLAIHSYFHGDPSKATVSGLGDHYLDNLDGLIEKQGNLNLHESTKLDRIYTHPQADIVLTMPEYRLGIHNTNFPHAVVWNPGKDHSFKDLKEPNFLCVESAVILNAPQIKQNEDWTSRVEYTVSTE